jgi:hypothetical protein
MGTAHPAKSGARQQFDAGLPTHFIYPHMGVPDFRMNPPWHPMFIVCAMECLSGQSEIRQ